MNIEDVWRVIDEERSTLADLLEELSDQEWEQPSLCAAWRVRDVAAHLTLAHLGWGAAAVELLRAGGGFNRMIRDTALRQARLPVAELPPRLRAMVGSRRKAPGVTALEPMLDLLVHGQDITVPLGRHRPVPCDAAAAAATRAWEVNWPFRTRRRLHGLQLVATDIPWKAGTGLPLQGGVADLLLLVTGRPVDAAHFTGAGVETLRSQSTPPGDGLTGGGSRAWNASSPTTPTTGQGRSARLGLTARASRIDEDLSTRWRSEACTSTSPSATTGWCTSG
jgi:uncharacterized protein (TIGR03083 family)